MFRFKAKTEEEVSIKPLKEGFYKFKVIEAQAKTTRETNLPMLALTLELINGDKTRKVFDNIVFDEKDSWDWKIRHFCYSCGLEQAYESETLTPNQALNKTGIVNIGIKKDNKGVDQNRVLDYMTPENLAKSKVKSSDPFAEAIPANFDDDIKF